MDQSVPRDLTLLLVLLLEFVKELGQFTQLRYDQHSVMDLQGYMGERSLVWFIDLLME